MSSEFSEMEKLIGPRLIEAFEDAGITSRAEMGEVLGFRSAKAIYKVINGEQELGFGALRAFAEATGCLIDWLLRNEPPKSWTAQEIVKRLVGRQLLESIESCWKYDGEQKELSYNTFLENLIRDGLSVRSQRISGEIDNAAITRQANEVQPDSEAENSEELRLLLKEYFQQTELLAVFHSLSRRERAELIVIAKGIADPDSIPTARATSPQTEIKKKAS